MECFDGLACKIFGIFEWGRVVRCRCSTGELQAVLSMRWRGDAASVVLPVVGINGGDRIGIGASTQF